MPSGGMFNYDFHLTLPKTKSYKYPYFIKTPQQLNMAMGDGQSWGLDTIGGNMGALIEYIELLITGKSGASMGNSLDCLWNKDGICNSSGGGGGQPLGNAYFYDTSFTCMDGDISKNVSMYVNNIPTGQIPFMPGRSTGLNGLIPGIFEDVMNLNPQDILTAFKSNSDTSCVPVWLPVANITANGQTSSLPSINDGSSEPKYMYPGFANDVYVDNFYEPSGNSFVKLGCNPSKTSSDNVICPDEKMNEYYGTPEGFANINSKLQNNSTLQNTSMFYKEDDTIIQLYFIAITILFLFILLKLLYKRNN